MENPTLSILVLTTPRRIKTYFPCILNELMLQCNSKSIEILGLFDNKTRSVGHKRNNLISIAMGKYLTFVDDDDAISSDYADEIIGAIETNPGIDCICFDCLTTINRDENNKTYSKYSINYEYKQTPDKIDGYYQWRGKPAHTMVWKSEIAKRHQYINANYGEDIDWCSRASRDIKTEVQINKILYYYNFNSDTSETRL